MSSRKLFTHEELRRTFHPRSIAVVGATPNDKAFAGRSMTNLRQFDGKVLLVNPRYEEINGERCYPSLCALPEVPDCVLIATGRDTVEPIVRECGKLGVGGVVLFASDYAETGNPEKAADRCHSRATPPAPCSTALKISGLLPILCRVTSEQPRRILPPALSGKPTAARMKSSRMNTMNIWPFCSFGVHIHSCSVNHAGRGMRSSSAVFGLGFMLLLSFAAHAEKTCSNATLKGAYVFSTDGLIEPSQPGIRRVHAGILTFDGIGKFSGKQSSNRGGKPAREKLEGSYEIAPDCSGILTQGSILNPGMQTHWDLYVTHDGRRGTMTRMDNGSMATRSIEK